MPNQSVDRSSQSKPLAGLPDLRDASLNAPHQEDSVRDIHVAIGQARTSSPSSEDVLLHQSQQGARHPSTLNEQYKTIPLPPIGLQMTRNSPRAACSLVDCPAWSEDLALADVSALFDQCQEALEVKLKLNYNHFVQKKEELAPEFFEDRVFLERHADPVMCSDGFVHDREVCEKYDKSPHTREIMHPVMLDRGLQAAITGWDFAPANLAAGPLSVFDPVTEGLLVDPVFTSNGQTYSRETVKIIQHSMLYNRPQVIVEDKERQCGIKRYYDFLDKENLSKKDVRVRAQHTSEASYHGIFVGQKFKEGLIIFSSSETYRGSWGEKGAEGFGQMRFLDQSLYDGQWFENRQHGYGVHISAKNGVIEGLWRHGRLADGAAQMTNPDGTTFAGWIRNGNWHGFGKKVNGEGNEFQALWCNGRARRLGRKIDCKSSSVVSFDDVGEIITVRTTFENGDIYEGQDVNGHAHGRGILIKLDGSTYEGQFDQGVQSGFGEQRNDANIVWYRGLFLRGLRHGYGEALLANGKRFKGNWQSDLMSGAGTLETPEGSISKGVWKDGELEDLIEYIFPETDRYSERKIMIQSGKWHDKSSGIIYYKNGDVYTGSLDGFVRDGFGKIYLSGIATYEGNWNRDKIDGVGKAEISGGATLEGTWHRVGTNSLRDYSRTPSDREVGYLGMPVSLTASRFAEPNGCVFEGDWHCGFLEGAGSIRLPSGVSYKGDFVRGHLKGRVEVTDGEKTWFEIFPKKRTLPAWVYAGPMAYEVPPDVDPVSYIKGCKSPQSLGAWISYLALSF